MTSQKKTPTKRNLELPDWTAEVKPSEDVMALFYAPTGVPKAGALNPIFPISSNNQSESKSPPSNKESDKEVEIQNKNHSLNLFNETTNSSTSLLLEKSVTEKPITDDQSFIKTEPFNTLNSQQLETKEIKEIKEIKEPTSKINNNLEMLLDRDRFSDRDQSLDQKDQKNSKKIPYHNPTQYRNDTVSDYDRVSLNDTVSNTNIVSNEHPHTKLVLSKGFLAIPLHLLDDLAKTLTPTEWTLYLRLFRLSYGWHKDTCIVGLEALSQATNIGRTVLRETLKSLQNRKLIQVIETINTKELKGTKYRIYTLSENNTVSKSDRVSINNTVSSNDTGSISDTNKYIDDDHDDYLNKDHHQSTMPNVSDHEKQVMMIYQEVTHNLWSKVDHNNYQKIKHIPFEKIEIAIRLANNRATNRPNSFAFFIKEILASVNPKPQSRTTRKKAMQKIVERVRNASVGSNISPSEFVHKVKDACLREDVAFDNDLLNEVMDK